LRRPGLHFLAFAPPGFLYCTSPQSHLCSLPPSLPFSTLNFARGGSDSPWPTLLTPGCPPSTGEIQSRKRQGWGKRAKVGLGGLVQLSRWGAWAVTLHFARGGSDSPWPTLLTPGCPPSSPDSATIPSEASTAESGLDGGHPGVNKVGHGESDPPRAKFRVEKGKDAPILAFFYSEFRPWRIRFAMADFIDPRMSSIKPRSYANSHYRG
jgi:hypothetical protein